MPDVRSAVPWRFEILDANSGFCAFRRKHGRSAPNDTILGITRAVRFYVRGLASPGSTGGFDLRNLVDRRSKLLFSWSARLGRIYLRFSLSMSCILADAPLVAASKFALSF